MIQFRRLGALLACALGLGGCAAPSTPVAGGGSAWSGSAASWAHYPLPGKKPTEFLYVRHEGRDAVAANAAASASLLRTPLRIDPDNLGSIRFSWKVQALIAQADMAVREQDDAPVRIVLAFEGDRSRFSVLNAALSDLSRTLTGEDLPYATLMYVWCNTRRTDAVITSPRTDRIRKIVVETGAGGLNQWRDYERDIRADYQRAFGEPPGALVGVAIMSDTDNTRSSARAWYGPVRFVPTSR